LSNEFRNWILGIAAGLVLLAVSGGVFFDREVAQRVSTNEAQIKSINQQIEDFRVSQRLTGIYNRNDAERDFRLRDEAISRLEQRVDRVDHK